MNAPVPIVRIVDDDASFLAAVARMLRVSGFAVKAFDSAAAWSDRSLMCRGAFLWICRCPA
ncbi:MAG: hypothetical protein V1844_15150 [Pseudomonadota bacterium]